MPGAVGGVSVMQMRIPSRRVTFAVRLEWVIRRYAAWTCSSQLTELLIRKTVEAKPETVFDVFTDHRGYARLVRLIRSVDLEREGEPAPNGIGAIRALHTLGPTIREEVTEYERPGRFSYRMLSGAPMRDYVSTMTFSPAGSGTTVSCQVRATPTTPVIGFAVAWLAKVVVRVIVRGAIAEAERRA
jgi:Polyketide cyclase / dehydrase and lipid transport